MSTALLVELFDQLPERLVRNPGVFPGTGSDDGRSERAKTRASYPGGKARWRAALDSFKQQVAKRYLPGTLARLLVSPDARARRAAAFALGLLGTADDSAVLAGRLQHDDDPETVALAADALWSLWFRADTGPHNEELQRLVRLRDREKALQGLDQLIAQAPTFAEAYNQRAILHFRFKKFDLAKADCEKTLHLNRYHFGAQAGLGQCWLQLRKHRSALKAFRLALKLNPHLEVVAEAIRELERALGEEGRRDDKK
jgi:tetratricopeptide (TPR) repeat protein